MKLSLEQIKFIKENEYVIFATASKNGIPRAAIVIPSRVEENRIIISNVQMEKSEQNIRENNNVFISSYKDDTQVKISGTCEYIDFGELFEEIKEFEKSNDVDVKGIIVINISSVEQTEG